MMKALRAMGIQPVSAVLTTEGVSAWKPPSKSRIQAIFHKPNQHNQ